MRRCGSPVTAIPVKSNQVTAAVCLRNVCKITSFPKYPHLVFPVDMLQVVSHFNVLVFPENKPPYISSATNCRQPTDRPSHTPHLVLSLSTATVYKNEASRIKISLKNTANVLRNIVALSCNHCYSGETISITYSEYLSVALCIQHALLQRSW